MEFEHAHHREVHDTVGQFLSELFENPHHDPENGHYYVGYGSTVMEISVEPYGPEETIVLVMAFCVQDVEPSEELLRGLLRLNHQIPVGAFSVVDRDVYLGHSIFGRDLGRKNLLGVIAAVANLSDEYDDRIVDRYGGQTALDRIRATGGRKRRHETSPAN